MEHKNFSRDVFLLVDESHRSNYGLLATKMRAVFPQCLLHRLYRNAFDEKREEYHGEIRKADP